VIRHIPSIFAFAQFSASGYSRARTGERISESILSGSAWYGLDLNSELSLTICSGVMAVYSITRKDSFDTIDRRLEMLKAEGVVNDPVFMLVGNKCDLESLREVSTEHGQEYAKRHGYLFVETSAKESTNVDAAFDALIAGALCSIHP